MERYFSTRMPGTRFLRNVLFFSLAGLLPVLVVYVLLTPGFASALAEGGPPLQRFIRQVLTNGLPVVFVVNYSAFFLFALTNERIKEDSDPAIYLVYDAAIRIVVFLGLHAIIYVVSADWFGSFGGSRATALRVVAPTIARSALFENISGVYLYATLISAVPLYVTVVGKSRSLRPYAGMVPMRLGALIISVVWFLVAVLFLTFLARLIAILQG
jgi:hypothetical protein